VIYGLGPQVGHYLRMAWSSRATYPISSINNNNNNNNNNNKCIIIIMLLLLLLFVLLLCHGQLDNHVIFCTTKFSVFSVTYPNMRAYPRLR
jgi:hypothetical protein